MPLPLCGIVVHRCQAEDAIFNNLHTRLEEAENTQKKVQKHMLSGAAIRSRCVGGNGLFTNFCTGKTRTTNATFVLNQRIL